MPTNTEKAINTKLAECLRAKHPGWTVGAEQTGVFMDKMKQPDLVISHQERLTVIIESEFAPASNLAKDAKGRLMQLIRQSGEKVEQCIAIKLPTSLRQVNQADLAHAVRTGRYAYAIFSYEDEDNLFDPIVRWPAIGWLEGGLNELADCIETVALSEQRVARGTIILEVAVSQTAGHLSFRAPAYVLHQLAQQLHQEEGLQTTRMAMAILANAVIFHMRLARLHTEIQDLGALQTDHGIFRKYDILDCWKEILNINYWPIFHSASELLKILPDREAHAVLAQLHKMSSELQSFGAADIQDLSGRMFQQLITDRKFLATFYTLPASSALLAELAVSRLAVDWSDPDQITALKVADLACGTGALLGAAYHALASRYRRTGGHDGALHARMMERVLTAADILPSAVHLTAATLSGIHPGKTFHHTRVINMLYGERENEEDVSIGSLDLIQSDQTHPLFGTGRTALSGQGVVEENAETGTVDLPHESMDLVIMNPPFTRPTNHEATGIPVPSFAGFRTKEEEQSKMSARLKEIRKDLKLPAGHGNAGLASNFIDLAHAKLRPGGILALVLPASFLQGRAWENARTLIRAQYEEILIVGIASEGSTDRAFSADTGIAEVLLVATRKKESTEDVEDLMVVNLLARPKTLLEGLVTAQQIEQKRRDQGVDVGTIPWTPSQEAGNYVRTKAWTGLGVRETGLMLFMNSLEQGKLLLPRMGRPVTIPVCKLEKLGHRGFLDRDMNGLTRGGKPRGPFDIEALTRTPEYPVLWGHNADRERCLIVAPDSQGRSRPGHREQAADLWQKGASRLHYNRDFRLNSQSLAACLTPQLSLGGRAWPNFLTKDSWEIPVVLWANTTPGLISFWWAGSRQQQGRSILTITRLPELLSLDADRLSEEQIDLSRKIFEEFQNKSLRPANEAYRDEVRKELDRAVLIDLLQLKVDVLDQLAILREQWCAEPSVHGGKSSRPNE